MSSSSSSSSSTSSKPLEAKPRFLRDLSTLDYYKGQLLHAFSTALNYAPRQLSRSVINYMRPPDNHTPRILWVAFQSLALRAKASPAETQLHLVLGFSDAFQIWNITDIHHIVEVVFLREESVKCLEYIPLPEQPSSESFHVQSHPLIAYACPHPSKKKDHSVVKIYSLTDQKVHHTIPIGSAEIHRICANSRYLALCWNSKIVVYSTSEFSQVRSFDDCHINPYTGHGVMALGPRWIAYATTSSVDPKNVSSSKKSEANVAKMVLTGVQTSLQTGLNMIGDFVGHPSTDRSSASSPTQATAENQQGMVVVKDLETSETIAHFVAHSDSPVSFLRFSPNGALLATASTTGFEVYVFQLLAWGSNDHPTEKKLYKLIRSKLNRQAVIEDIVFSPNGKWIAFTSAYGTSHVFPINPFGGLADVVTHAGVDASRIKGYKQRAEAADGPVYSDLRCTIKHSDLKVDDEETASSLSGASIIPSTPVAAVFYFNPNYIGYPDDQSENASSTTESPDTEVRTLAPPSLRPQLINVYPSGHLVFSVIKPVDVYIPKTANNPLAQHKLDLTYENIIEWQVGRTQEGEEQDKIFVSLPTTSESPSDRNEDSNHGFGQYFDTSTHPEMKKKLWNGTQFSFKVFASKDAEDTPAIHSESAESLTSLETRTLDVRRREPIPVSESSVSNPFNQSNIAAISANMKAAITTRMDAPPLSEEYDDTDNEDFLEIRGEDNYAEQNSSHEDYFGRTISLTGSVEQYSPAPREDDNGGDGGDNGGSKREDDGAIAGSGRQGDDDDDNNAEEEEEEEEEGGQEGVAFDERDASADFPVTAMWSPDGDNELSAPTESILRPKGHPRSSS